MLTRRTVPRAIPTLRIQPRTLATTARLRFPESSDSGSSSGSGTADQMPSDAQAVEPGQNSSTSSHSGRMGSGTRGGAGESATAKQDEEGAKKKQSGLGGDGP
ncbi:hypothetical protein H2203_005402 [Taxawa tesnikishii (nom. ined.)]|nr:hypothetical protein H2203_005402 [Dothideales sp. JES 119]